MNQEISLIQSFKDKDVKSLAYFLKMRTNRFESHYFKTLVLDVDARLKVEVLYGLCAVNLLRRSTFSTTLYSTLLV